MWDWSWPLVNKYFGYDISAAPWLQDPGSDEEYRKYVGWMIEGLAIDPFDSNHFLYGTGATIYGSHNLAAWDTARNFTLRSLATGIEETSVQGLIAPPTGPKLLSAVGDITGFVHNSLDVAPTIGFKTPFWATTLDIDYAGGKPGSVVRVGSDSSGATKQIAVSADYGVTWSEHQGAPSSTSGGKVALSADGATVLWRTGSGSVLVAAGANAAFTAVASLPSNSVIAADKKTASIFYAASGTNFYISRNSGATFTLTGRYTTAGTSNPVKIVAHPKLAGDVWVSSDAGLFHSANSGTTFTAAAGVSRGYQFALGAPATTGEYPAVYLVGTVADAVGVFRSDNTGATWYRINDAAHGFGSPDSVPVAADLNTYGRFVLSLCVYVCVGGVANLWMGAECIWAQMEGGYSMAIYRVRSRRGGSLLCIFLQKNCTLYLARIHTRLRHLEEKFVVLMEGFERYIAVTAYHSTSSSLPSTYPVTAERLSQPPPLPLQMIQYMAVSAHCLQRARTYMYMYTGRWVSLQTWTTFHL